MVTNTYQSGNTVRLSCEFFDFNKETKDPTIIKLKIYDYKYNLLDEFANVVREVTGKYHFDYVTDVDNKTYIYEWYGEIDGTPSLKRGSFITKFM